MGKTYTCPDSEAISDNVSGLPARPTESMRADKRASSRSCYCSNVPERSGP